jgi:hypothetical protein
MYLGQANQDKFVLKVLKEKKNGFFLEIGSNHPININNTYLLEKKYNWRGIMIEYDHNYLGLYKKERNNSIHIIQDATNIDYKILFETNNVPLSFDYLQIDLEVSNGSTLKTLEKLDDEVFDTYKFATVTFEHDIYCSNFNNTRLKSREIFKKRGYVCVFEDINNQNVIYPYEDWYVYPELVDMEYVNKLIEQNKTKYTSHPTIERTINWEVIEYDVI